MIAAVSCLLFALACQDVARVAGPNPTPPKASLAASPPVLLSLTCTLESKSTAVSCKSAPPSTPAGIHANVVYGATFTYAIFFPYNLVKDTVAQTWQFTAYLQNLLKQSVGTLNGTTVTGVKVVVTDFHATAGTGSVSIANADGTGNFTAPNQPYFNYNQIIAPSAYSANKLWKFNVPKTVTAVEMSILISTDFPAEQNVTAQPPTTVPDWVHNDTSISGPTDSIGGRFTKRILIVRFRPSAALADRQLAIAYINGAVVGGSLNPDGSGYYYVQVSDDGTGSKLVSAGERLQTLPQVESAAPEYILDQLYLKPKDGGDFNTWKLDPDSADTTKKNWAPTAIDAPFAWGCDTGEVSAPVGVVDDGFHAPTDLAGNLPGSSYALSPGSGGEHGTFVSSIIAAKGNNNQGMTGIMWNAGLRIEDPAVDPDGTHKVTFATTISAADRVARLASQGVRIVNLSFGLEYKDRFNHYRQPKTHDDTLRAGTIARQFMDGLRDARKKGLTASLPLLVIPAGNFAHVSRTTPATTDAWWSGMTQLRDSLGDTVLVVGASTRSRTVAYFSGVNVSHQYVEIMAPGDDVYVLHSNGTLEPLSGTSLAAPHVTGTGGLLLSFDPSIGSLTAGRGLIEMKRLLLAGADSNRSPATTQIRRAGTYRFLNAYESLKEAARRPGAPLCGNRVWGTGASGQLIAQRGVATEILATVAPKRVYTPTTYHGGKQITFLVGLPDSPPNPYLPGYHFQCELLSYTSNGSWTVSPPRCDSRDTLVGVGSPPLTGFITGAANSQNGLSHNSDSSVAVITCPTPNCFRVLLNDIQIATISRANDSLGTLARVAYSPYGDRALVALSQYDNVLFNGINVPSLRNADVYEVRLSNGHVTPLPGWSMTGKGIFSLGLSEDGRTAVANIGQSFSPAWDGTPCTIEYRDPSGTQLSPAVSPISNYDACMEMDRTIDYLNRQPGSSAARLVPRKRQPIF